MEIFWVVEWIKILKEFYFDLPIISAIQIVAHVLLLRKIVLWVSLKIDLIEEFNISLLRIKLDTTFQIDLRTCNILNLQTF